MSAPVLIVSGCSAVGKSTVSRLMAQAVTPSVHLPIDLFLRLFDDPFPDPESQEGARRYETVGAAAAAAAAQFAVGGYTVFLDSPMFPAGAEGTARRMPSTPPGPRSRWLMPSFPRSGMVNSQFINSLNL